MIKQNQSNYRSPLSHYILISIILHFSMILIIGIFPELFTIAPKPEPKIVWVELPKGTGEEVTTIKEVQRLPEIPTQEIKPIKPLPDEKKAMKEPEKKKIEKKPPPKSKVNDALAKIDKKLKEREIAQTKAAGEGFEAGTSDKPLKDEDYHSALLKYRALVKARILRQWIPPQTGETGTINVTVFISKSGDVISTQWARRSSSEALNQSAVRAIHRASPFPIPPDPLKWEAYKEGFSVVFNPSNR